MLLLSLIVSTIAVGLWKLVWLICHEFTSPLRHLPGPKATSLIYGNMGDIWSTQSMFLQAKWVEEYGSTLRYKGFFCRRIMNPAFGPAQIRALTGIFFAKAIQLRDVLSSEIAKNPAGKHYQCTYRYRFNYNIDALNANGNTERVERGILGCYRNPEIWYSEFTAVSTDNLHKVQVSHRTMQRIGRELLTSAKAVARAGAKETGEIDKSSIHGRDLFTQLVKANMATDIPESQRLSDEDVLGQFSTFLITGHETTSTATAWALHEMALAPEIQIKLREELMSVDTETLSMDDLMALPYLDAVVKETLRVNPPLSCSFELARISYIILPVKRITKGDPIVIPILAMNTSQELWGPDAHEFKPASMLMCYDERPERWDNVPEAVSDIPGVWSHLLTFLGGPRRCIGYRFAVVEMKALLFTLVRAFEFELALPASEIGRHSVIVQRPVLRGDPMKKPQLPLLLKPYQRE
ncbi:cytochrome P450 [Melanogaster broomeanus]|nr:cytochrome P450 [Melanogaster broomeanus]